MGLVDGKAMYNDILVHHDLRLLRTRLQDIYLSAASFEQMTPKPPILDSSLDINSDEGGQENVPGMRILREAIKCDLDRLEAVSLIPWNETCRRSDHFMAPSSFWQTRRTQNSLRYPPIPRI